MNLKCNAELSLVRTLQSDPLHISFALSRGNRREKTWMMMGRRVDNHIVSFARPLVPLVAVSSNATYVALESVVWLHLSLLSFNLFLVKGTTGYKSPLTCPIISILFTHSLPQPPATFFLYCEFTTRLNYFPPRRRRLLKTPVKPA